MKKTQIITNLAKSYFAYIKRQKVCNYYPLKLWIETTARCNLACTLCINRKISPSDKGDMKMELFRKIIDQSKDFVFEANLFHRGEPLLHPEIDEMVSYAASNGIKTCIHTNATLLDSNLSEKLIRAGLSKIYFSLDTFIKSDYEKNRTGADFDKTLQNIIDFLKIKKEMGLKKPYAVIQLMDINDALGGTSSKSCKNESFKSRFKDLPLDAISKRKAHNWGGNLDRVPVNKSSQPHTIACTFPWYCLTVFYDGKVFLCPQDFMGEYPVGDINDQDIIEIFNDGPIFKIREDFRNKNIPETAPCGTCDRIRRKTFAAIPLKERGRFPFSLF
jgi:MoaA/NifB/PqqE/SkfB family radical SAM enzyme